MVPAPPWGRSVGRSVGLGRSGVGALGSGWAWTQGVACARARALVGPGRVGRPR